MNSRLGTNTTNSNVLFIVAHTVWDVTMPSRWCFMLLSGHEMYLPQKAR